jgi:hypothetical protein
MSRFHESRVPHTHPLEDDGAPHRCVDCEVNEPDHRTMLVVCTPDGGRRVLHEKCIAPEWLAKAEKRKALNPERDGYEDTP